MCQALTALIADGRMEGQTEEMIRIIRKMVEKGLEVLDIAKLLDKPEEDTERMIELVKNNPKKSNSELAKELIKRQK